MQDRYTGDIGDFIKYGLLRALTPTVRLGVAWYLFPNESHNEDGKHTSYLDAPDTWRHLDPALFDGLTRIVSGGRREVGDVERSSLLGNAKFASEILNFGDGSISERRAWRKKWFNDVLEQLSDCDVVFADPDNGLCNDDKFNFGKIKDWKRLPLIEAHALASGRTAVLYHHNTRRVGGHESEISYWIEQLGRGTLALRWRAYSSRTFFIVNPISGMKERLLRFADEWGPKAEFHGGEE